MMENGRGDISFRFYFFLKLPLRFNSDTLHLEEKSQDVPTKKEFPIFSPTDE